MSVWILISLIDVFASPQVQPEQTAARTWEQMDYGPFLTASVSLPWPAGAVTPKGIVVKTGTGAMCFDTDLLRYAAGWTDGTLNLQGPVYDGIRKPDDKTRPTPKGTIRFVNRNLPGWTTSEEFRDPRPEPYGPLPAAQAKYRGLFVHGDRVVFSYIVGACDVLERPGSRRSGGGEVLTRTLRMGPSQRPLWMLVAEAPDAGEARRSGAGIEVSGLPIAAAGLPTGTEWDIVEKSRVYLKIPAHSDPILFEIAFGGEASRAVEDPVEEIRGGPSRYGRVLETRGSLGRTGAAYEIDTLTPPDDNPWKSWLRFTGLDFFADGRAAISTWSGDVWIVSGIDATLERVRWRRFATGLFQPGGLKIVKDQVYVVGRDQITRLQDLNGDGEADFYENFNNDCTDKGNYHEFALDLNTDAEGNFYYSKAGLGANFPGGSVGAHHGCMVKVSRDGKTFEVFATGIRAGGGSGIGPRGEITVSDNDGHWGPASRINLLRRGGYYGDPYSSHRNPAPKEFDAPLCWIHRSADNSAGAQVWVPGDAWGPFKGRMLHTSYGASALFQVLVDEGDGVAQGGVVRFPFKFSSGALRARFHPTDGQLYVAGLRGWESNASRDGCFQRVRYTGKPVHTVSGMHVTQDGLELTFTNPLDPATAADPDNYSAEWWNYAYSEKYGSPEFSVADPKKFGRDAVEIRSIRLSADGRKVSLEIPGMRPVMQMLVRYRLRAADHSPVTQDLWLTIHRVPGSH